VVESRIKYLTKFLFCSIINIMEAGVGHREVL